MRPVVTEKAVMKIEAQNTLTFEVSKIKSKENIKKEFEEIFKAKIQKIRTLVKGNKKYAYIQLKKEFPAIDIATKLGLM